MSRLENNVHLSIRIRESHYRLEIEKLKHQNYKMRKLLALIRDAIDETLESNPDE